MTFYFRPNRILSVLAFNITMQPSAFLEYTAKSLIDRLIPSCPKTLVRSLFHSLPASTFPWHTLNNLMISLPVA